MGKWGKTRGTKGKLNMGKCGKTRSTRGKHG